jgi:hypothetical protein
MLDYFGSVFAGKNSKDRQSEMDARNEKAMLPKVSIAFWATSLVTKTAFNDFSQRSQRQSHDFLTKRHQEQGGILAGNQPNLRLTGKREPSLD